MTTSNEPSASAGAESGPGEAQTATDGATPASQAPASPETTAGRADGTLDGVGTVAPDTIVEDSALSEGDFDLDGEEVYFDGDDFDEEDDEYDDEGESGWRSLLRWRPSRQVILVVGSVVLAVALLVPLTLAAFGARGVGPLAARATPTIIPTATPTPPQKVALQDPLTKRSSRWPEQQDCSMRDDGYHITSNSICFLAGAPITDSFVTVTVAQTAGVNDLSYGVTLRRANKGDYYSFEIDGSGHWYFYKAADSVLILLASHAPNPSIHTGLLQPNTLQVRANGQRFEFFVNDVKVGQVNDSTYAEGVIGLGGNDQLEVVYTNFTLSQPA